MSEVILSSIQVWRQRAREGTLSVEDMREAVAAIRRERVGAAGVSSAAKERSATVAAKKKPIDSDALLDELDNL